MARTTVRPPATSLPPGARETALELLLACVLEHPEEEDREFLGGVLDLPLAAGALR
jgi:hypothetical protein